MKRDLNELYGMVCSDRNEYLQAVQAVVTFSGLHGEELQRVLPKLQGPQPELTIHDVRGYTPYYERDMWKNGNKKEAEKVEQSVNKIKKAVDNEVKEKFNTKSTDAKDIFNELFGEPKK